MPDMPQSNIMVTALGVGGALMLVPPIGVPLVVHAAAGAVVGGLGMAVTGALFGPVVKGMSKSGSSKDAQASIIRDPLKPEEPPASEV